MGAERGKGIPGIGNSIYKGTEAGNTMVCLGTVAEKKHRDMCASAEDCSPTQHWTSTKVKGVWGLMGKIQWTLNYSISSPPQIAYEPEGTSLENCLVLKFELEPRRIIVMSPALNLLLPQPP